MGGSPRKDGRVRCVEGSGVEEEEEIELVQPTGAIEVGYYVIVAVVGRAPGKVKGPGYWERSR